MLNQRWLRINPKRWKSFECDLVRYSIRFILVWSNIYVVSFGCCCTHECVFVCARGVTPIIDDVAVDGNVNADDGDDVFLFSPFFHSQLSQKDASYYVLSPILYCTSCFLCLCQPFLFVLFFWWFFATVFSIIPLNASIAHWKLFGRTEVVCANVVLFRFAFVLLDYSLCLCFLCVYFQASEMKRMAYN